MNILIFITFQTLKEMNVDFLYSPGLPRLPQCYWPWSSTCKLQQLQLACYHRVFSVLLLQQMSDWPEVHASRRNGFLLSGVQEKDGVLMGRKPNCETKFCLISKSSACLLYWGIFNKIKIIKWQNPKIFLLLTWLLMILVLRHFSVLLISWYRMFLKIGTLI